MSRRVTPSLKPSLDPSEAWLLDDELWDIPAWLTDRERFAHAGPGWRRDDPALNDPEDDR